MTNRQKENLAFLIFAAAAIVNVVLWSISGHHGDMPDELGWFFAGVALYSIGYATGLHRSSQ